MSSLDMDGPFDLTKKEVERVIRETFSGNYAIGHMTKENRFVVKYVGRGDSGVRDALLKEVPRENGEKPGFMARLFRDAPQELKFKFSYAADAEAAYSKQCRNYHGFGGSEKLRNEDHPKPPLSSSAKCEVCGRR